MKKDIKDYLHLYFYSEIEITEVFISVGYKVGQRFVPSGGELALAIRENPVFACKPILRPLSSMTEEEAKEIGWWDDWDNRIAYAKDFKEDWMFSSSNMLWLLKNSFDLFNLIPERLAVNAETLK